jgi:Mor family transcriptional regulator
MPDFNDMPKSLKSLMVILSRKLVELGIRPTTAAEAAAGAVQEWQERYSGNTFYVAMAAKANINDKHQAIYNDYETNPENSLEICQKYSISRRWLYVIVSEERDRKAGKAAQIREQSGSNL